MTEPVKLLFEEHEAIVEAIELARNLKGLEERDALAYEKAARLLISFFRDYADKYHHHKEEEILFPEMSKRNELLAEGIIKEMLDNHEDFRSTLTSIESFLNKKDFRHAQQQMELYGEALSDHIAVENDEVFQVAESLMDEQELNNMYYRFLDCDRDLGAENKDSLLDSLRQLQKELS